MLLLMSTRYRSSHHDLHPFRCSVRLHRQRCLQSQLKWLTRRHEGSPVAAHIFTSQAGPMDQMTVSGIMMLGSSRALWRHTYFYFIATSKVLHRAVDITRSSSLAASTWTCLWGYGRHARLVLPLQRNSHPHRTCENAARSSHRYIHIRPEVVGWAPPV